MNLVQSIFFSLALLASSVQSATPVRFATYNASLNRNSAGQLITNLSTGNDSQAKAVAQIIQIIRPDVLLINEFDYDESGPDGSSQAAASFQTNYLSVAQSIQGPPSAPIVYPYVYAAPSNTGVDSGFDLDNNGSIGGPNDAFGFGFYSGQYAFVIYSMYEIDFANIRTFQTFLWKDMPSGLLPDLTLDSGLGDFYSTEELDVFRLSSKNHVDVPILIDSSTVHFLCSHPTPPVFDGPEDRNGRRNFDEIRFWKDYINNADYIYDDKDVTGGLPSGELFVIAGDQNSDPYDGDSVSGSAQLLLEDPLVNTDVTPTSGGGAYQAIKQAGANTLHQGNPVYDTSDFGFSSATPTVDVAPGNLRVDYCLPSRSDRLILENGGIFWPFPDDGVLRFPDRYVEYYPLANYPTSDHRLVYINTWILSEDLSKIYSDDFSAATLSADWATRAQVRLVSNSAITSGNPAMLFRGGNLRPSILTLRTRAAISTAGIDLLKVSFSYMFVNKAAIRGVFSLSVSTDAGPFKEVWNSQDGSYSNPYVRKYVKVTSVVNVSQSETVRIRFTQRAWNRVDVIFLDDVMISSLSAIE